MRLSTLSTALPALVAGCTAAYNLWLWWLRPSERAHLWLAVAAFGVMWVGAGIGLLYEATSVAEAKLGHTTSMAGAPFLVVGFLRFTSVLLDVDIRRLEWTAGIYTIAFALAYVSMPGWFLTDTPIELTGPFGEPHVIAEARPTQALMMPGFLLMFGALAFLFWTRRGRIESSNLLFGSIVFWAATATSDVAIANGLYRGPYLVVFGFVGFALAFTGLLQQRFVRSVTQLEADAEALQHVVEEHTQALREKDLQLTHGSRMATVGALSARLANEIRRPIQAVEDGLDRLAAAAKDPTAPDDFEEVLDRTRAGADRIRVIVSDLLRISRRDASDEAPVDLVDVVESVLPLLAVEARGRARIDLDLEPVPLLMGRHTLLSQVVLNLVANALQAFEEPDEERCAVRVRTAFEDGSIWLTVEDNGPGIPEAQLDRLFDPFGPGDPQAEETRAGLGLAVTHQLVLRHRGEIFVENGEQGARFVIELPPFTAEDAPATEADE